MKKERKTKATTILCECDETKQNSTKLIIASFLFRDRKLSNQHFLRALPVGVPFGEEDEDEDEDNPDRLFSAMSLEKAFWTSSLSSMKRIFFFSCSSGVPFSRTWTSGMSISSASSRNRSSTSEQ